MGIEQEILRGCGAVISNEGEREVELRAKKAVGKPRYELIDREQLCWRRVDVERLIGEEHPGRAIWEFVGKLDLSRYRDLRQFPQYEATFADNAAAYYAQLQARGRAASSK